jgi:hypothetical protein
MLEAPIHKRIPFRRSTGLIKPASKGFLKIAREKLMRQQTLQLQLVKEEVSTPYHRHQRSQSSVSFTEEESEYVVIPNLAYVQQPLGDF